MLWKAMPQGEAFGSRVKKENFPIRENYTERVKVK